MSAALTAKQEWQENWPIVFAATMGFSLHSLSAYSIGLFMLPLENEFGWSRTQISVVSVIPSIIMVLFSPSTGAFIDKWGSRRIAVPSLLLTGITLAMIGLANGSMWQWMGLWFLYGTLSLGIKATVWTTAVSNRFKTSRGLALGTILCGTAIAQIIVPPLTQFLIDSVGWRLAYVWLGLGWSIPCCLLAYFFLHDRKTPPIKIPSAEHPAAAEPAYGLTLHQALRSVPLIRIGLATLLTMFIGTAILIHQVPILTALGTSRSEAAWLASLAGMAGIAGKLLTGVMVDRWNASMIAAISLTAPALAYFLLMDASYGLTVQIVALMIIGYTAGTKLQLTAYLTAKYAGLAHYGKIFGVMTSLVGIGGGIGSTAAGAIFDYFGDYIPLLMFGIASSFACGALMLGLGAYPDWSRPPNALRMQDSHLPA